MGSVGEGHCLLLLCLPTSRVSALFRLIYQLSLAKARRYEESLEELIADFYIWPHIHRLAEPH